MFLIITNKEDDPHCIAVGNFLTIKGYKYKIINVASFPGSLRLAIHLKNESHYSIVIDSNNEVLTFPQDFKVAWIRADLAPYSSLENRDMASYIELESKSLLEALYYLPNSLKWVNHPLADIKASNKPLQLTEAINAGFRVPETIFGNSFATIENVYKFKNHPLALKTIASPGLFIQLNKLQRLLLFVNILFTGNTLKLLKNKKRQFLSYALLKAYTKKVNYSYLAQSKRNIENCPCIVQEYISKDIELRVSIIGKKVFACAIHSQESVKSREDWRNYDLENTPYKKFELPDEIRDKCLLLMNKLGLNFGFIDMILTPEEHYIFLEVNPIGQWLWIESLTGLPISEAIADFLIETYKN